MCKGLSENRICLIMKYRKYLLVVKHEKRKKFEEERNLHQTQESFFLVLCVLWRDI